MFSPRRARRDRDRVGCRGDQAAAEFHAGDCHQLEAGRRGPAADDVHDAVHIIPTLHLHHGLPLMDATMLKYTIALASTVIVTAAAQAQVLPPPEYDHPYRGNLTIQRVATQYDLYRQCPNAARVTPNMIGCAKPNGDRCHIILVPDSVIKAARSTRARILRHEIGHCNGWRHPVSPVLVWR